jgi:hypothetical protein
MINKTINVVFVHIADFISAEVDSFISVVRCALPATDSIRVNGIV